MTIVERKSRRIVKNLTSTAFGLAVAALFASMIAGAQIAPQMEHSDGFTTRVSDIRFDRSTIVGRIGGCGFITPTTGILHIKSNGTVTLVADIAPFRGMSSQIRPENADLYPASLKMNPMGPPNGILVFSPAELYAPQNSFASIATQLRHSHRSDAFPTFVVFDRWERAYSIPDLFSPLFPSEYAIGTGRLVSAHAEEPLTLNDISNQQK